MITAFKVLLSVGLVAFGFCGIMALIEESLDWLIGFVGIYVAAVISLLLFLIWSEWQ